MDRFETADGGRKFFFSIFSSKLSSVLLQIPSPIWHEIALAAAASSAELLPSTFKVEVWYNKDLGFFFDSFYKWNNIWGKFSKIVVHVITDG